LINLLLIAEDTSTWFNRNHYFFETELAKITNLMVWRDSGNIYDIIKKLPKTPDFILIQNDIRLSISPVVTNLSKIHIPSGLFVNDTNRLVSLRKDFIEENKIKHIFPVARGNFYQIYPEYKDRMTWLPHHVNTDIFKDYGLNKDVELLMMGSALGPYPLRKKILNHYQGDSRFVYHRHPGYRNIGEQEEKKLFVGERYAREINRAKIFFTCGSILKIPVKKYFEVLACRTLLLADTFTELQDLGFVPGTHFVAINSSNFAEKADFYLKNEKERNKIADQGFKFVHQQHSTTNRANQLVEKIKAIISA